MRKFTLAILLVIAVLTLHAQEKEYTNLREAIFSGRNFSGGRGPANVVWIHGGSQYSFTKNNQGVQEIWIHDVTSGEETLAFSAEGLTMKDTDNPFRYMSVE